MTTTTAPGIAPGVDALPILWPDLPGMVHGIVCMDPMTVQCDGCCKRATWQDLGMKQDRANTVIILCGIRFNSTGSDVRRLCRDCAKAAGWRMD